SCRSGKSRPLSPRAGGRPPAVSISSSMSRYASADPTLGTKLAAVALVIIVAGCATRSRAPVEERSTPPPLPPAVATPAPASPVSPEPETRPPPTYVVKRGDTLYKIALDKGLAYCHIATA